MICLPKNHRHHSAHRVGSSIAAGIALLFIAPVAAFGSAVVHHDGGGRPIPSGITLSGKVVSLGNGSFVIQDHQGFWRTINLESSTTYSEGPMAVAPAATSANIALGSEVIATGVVGLDHTSLDASAIRIELDSLSGTVTSVSSTAVMVSNHETTATLTVSPSTVVFAKSGVTTLSAAAVGSFVRGFGVLQSNGSLLTLYLAVASPHESFEAAALFHGSLPNRLCPHHYVGHGFRR